MKTTMYGTGAKGRATRLHSLIVRARGRCEKCGSTSSLTTAHIMRRGYAPTRTDERNAFCLCFFCHVRFTEHEDEFLLFVDATIGMAEYERLRLRALSNVKVDWDAEARRLRAVASELGIAA